MGNDKDLKEIISNIALGYLPDSKEDQIAQAILSAGYVRRDKIKIDEDLLAEAIWNNVGWFGLLEDEKDKLRLNELAKALAQSDILTVEE